MESTSIIFAEKKKVEEKLKHIAMHEFNLTDESVLECGCVYIVKLLEALNLPNNIWDCKSKFNWWVRYF